MTESFNKTKNLTMCALFTALLTICSWISIPTAVPFSLQTFGVFLAALLLEGRWSSMVILIYLLCGIAGIPVFAGFQAGLGIVIGPLGGYMMGFFAITIMHPVCLHLFGRTRYVTFFSLLAGLILCYTLGTFWFLHVCGTQTVLGALSICVFPFVIPDILKLILAIYLERKISPAIKKRV